MNGFDRLAPFIKNYIYKKKWTELRDIQIAACEVLFDTDDNLLLSSGTSSGKTEAAFLPILTMLHEKPVNSVGVLYISPLKALINDQFVRLDELLKESNITVTSWHGDISQNKKDKLIKKPQGILQITPESLEGMLLNRKTECSTLFKDLRFVIIDEVHYFMDSSRGIQLLSLLERLDNLVGCNPRRVGLSATIGDYETAKAWLSTGTDRLTNRPEAKEAKRIIRIKMDSFPVDHDNDDNPVNEVYYEYLYNSTIGRKTIIFANSRTNAEHVISSIKMIAKKLNNDYLYHVHHANISTEFRRETELAMKTLDEPIVTAATTTLELGIDIGNLDRIIQIGCPPSSLSFVQRLGRCGRRGNPGEIIFALEEDVTNKGDKIEYRDWAFLKAISIIQLYIESKWVEPLEPSKYPYQLLYHQTMSFLASNIEVSSAYLAQNILGLSVFQNISKDDYRVLLMNMLELGHIQKTENNCLILGPVGERIVFRKEFYSVFISEMEFTVKSDRKIIGSVDKEYNKGEFLTLAGLNWVVTRYEKGERTIYVMPTEVKLDTQWQPKSNFHIDTEIVKKIHEVLSVSENYSYLSERSIEKLTRLRKIAADLALVKESIVLVGNSRYIIRPWLGSKQLIAFVILLKNNGLSCDVHDDYFILIEYDGSLESLRAILNNIINSNWNFEDFKINDDIINKKKFGEYIPLSLLKKQFIYDDCDFEGLKILSFSKNN